MLKRLSLISLCVSVLILTGCSASAPAPASSASKSTEPSYITKETEDFYAQKSDVMSKFVDQYKGSDISKATSYADILGSANNLSDISISIDPGTTYYWNEGDTNLSTDSSKEYSVIFTADSDSSTACYAFSSQPGAMEIISSYTDSDLLVEIDEDGSCSDFTSKTEVTISAYGDDFYQKLVESNTDTEDGYIYAVGLQEYFLAQVNAETTSKQN